MHDRVGDVCACRNIFSILGVGRDGLTGNMISWFHAGNFGGHGMA